MEGKSLRIGGRNYRFIRKIGTGAFGEVYAAQDERGTDFAIKILTIPPNPGRIDSFKNEFLLTTQLKHPFLAKAHDFVYSEPLGKYLFVSDYAPGVSFFDATAGKGPEEIERLAVQVLEVLDYLHLHEVIHFDIKCPNLIVSAAGTVKLLDFGLAQLENIPLKKFPGSLRYASPEILMRSRSTDHRADLYSFGMVLYRALTRRFPFNENDPGEMIDWHLQKEVSWNEGESRAIPTHLLKLVEFLLKKIPAERLSRAQAAINWINLHTENRYRSALASSPSSLPLEGRLVARDREMTEAGESLSNPAGRALIFTGVRGIGKSRLLREIKYMAEVRDLPCLWLDNFTRADGLSQLGRQLELPPLHSPDDFFRLSTEKIREKTPGVLLIDDLQEADPYFWEWLSRAYDLRLPLSLFLGWEGPPPAGGPLAPLFQRGALFPLAPFTRDDVRLYLSEVMPDKEDEWSGPLFDFSSGIPLLVIEGTRYLLEAKGREGLPSSIEQLYESGLLALSGDAIAILETLALWKSRATLEDLSRSIPLEMNRMAPLVPHLLSQGLISCSSSFNDPARRYRISNTALALVLKGRQKEKEKKGRLRRILASLERKEDHPPEELAALAEESGEREKARPYLFRLAENYEASFQTQKAIETYRRVLPFAKEDRETTSRVRKRLIPLLVLAGRPDEALALFPKKELLLPPDRKLMGWVLTRSGRFQEAMDLYRDGLEGSEENDPLHRELLNDLANAYVQTNEGAKALQLFRQTLPPDDMPEEERYHLLKSNNLGLALALSGKIEEARRFEAEKLALFRKKGDEHQIAVALSQSGFIELKGQNLPQASSYFQEALILSEKLGDLHNILIVLDNLITIFQRQGLYHEALRYFSRAVNYRSLVSPPNQIVQNYLKGAFLYLPMGLPEPARNCLEKIDLILKEFTSPLLEGWNALAWGYYHRAVGAFPEAADRFRWAIHRAEETQDPSLDSWGNYALADLRIEEGKLDEAASLCRRCRTERRPADEELRLRIELLSLVLQKEGRPSEKDPTDGLKKLAREAESKGMRELAAEAYASLHDPRSKEIYLEIASHLPEEYKIAYLSERSRSRALTA